MSDYDGKVDKERKPDGLSEFEKTEKAVNDILSQMTEFETTEIETTEIESSANIQSSAEIQSSAFMQSSSEPEKDKYGIEHPKTKIDNTYISPQNFQLAPKEMGYLVCNIYFEDGRGRTGVHLNWFDEKDHSKYGEAGRVIDFNIYNNGKLIKSDRHDRDGILGIPCNGIYSGNKGIEIYNSKGEKTGQSEFRIPPVSGQDEAGWHHDLNYEVLGIEGADPVENCWASLRADEQFVADNMKVINDTNESDETKLKANDAMTFFKWKILDKQRKIANWYASQKGLSNTLTKEEHLNYEENNIAVADNTRVVKVFIDYAKIKSTEDENEELKLSISKLERLLRISNDYVEINTLIISKHPIIKIIANKQTSTSDDLLEILRLIFSKLELPSPTIEEEACLQEFRKIYFEQKSYKVEMWDGTTKTSKPWLPKAGYWQYGEEKYPKPKPLANLPL